MQIGPYKTNHVYGGDCIELIPQLPDNSIDIVVTSPPYWGQRHSAGAGVEDDPREYIEFLVNVFFRLLPKLKEDGIVWINIGDAYNTPVNWRENDKTFSTLGANKVGLSPDNSAYIKPRLKRKAYLNKNIGWLKYGNLLALPYRLIIQLSDLGYFFRGEVIWKKRNPMPEGKCRRPHRHHESIYLLAKSDKHNFRVAPPVRSVWEFSNEKIDGLKHFSRFPEELPSRCIDAYGTANQNIVILDPFAGSGTTGIAAIKQNCSFIGFEIDSQQVEASNARLRKIETYKESPKLFSN